MYLCQVWIRAEHLPETTYIHPRLRILSTNDTANYLYASSTEITYKTANSNISFYTYISHVFEDDYVEENINWYIVVHGIVASMIYIHAYAVTCNSSYQSSVPFTSKTLY